MPTRRQAKGRVAWANQTRQDRLVKGLRRHGISAIDSAKARLPEFIADYSRAFRYPPARTKMPTGRSSTAPAN